MPVVSIKTPSAKDGARNYLIDLAPRQEVHNVFPLVLLPSGIQIGFDLSKR